MANLRYEKKGRTRIQVPTKRERISHFIEMLQKGTEFDACILAKDFDLSNGQQADRQLAQRIDVINIGRGKWRKI
jgi:hypothetical protein